MAEPRPSGIPSLPDANRVKLAVEVTAPEFEEPAQLGEIRGKVELLPDEALQQVGVVRQMVDYLRGRQSIIAQLLLLIAHLSALMGLILPSQTSMRDELLLDNPKNKEKQVISSL